MPAVITRASDSNAQGWRLKLAIEHNGNYLDGLVVAEEAMAAMRDWLKGEGLLTQLDPTQLL